MSKEWELTDEELGEAVISAGYLSSELCRSDRPIAKAAQKKLAEWSNELCDAPVKHYDYYKSEGNLRHQCPECWKKLCKEMGI